MASQSQIQQCLANTLNPDGQVRTAAEEQLATLLAYPEAGLSIAHLILSQDLDLGVRQMIAFYSASIALRKYVNERWSPYFQTFKGSAPPPETKTTIRQQVFQGLSDPNRKIRTLCAHTLSTIASCDWPDEYPDLLTSLIGLLSSNSPDSVHGAMQVLVEFIKADLTEDQILPILRMLLPVLMRILGGADQYTALTRARTVSVFRQCVTALYMVKDQHPQSVQEATSVILPEWLEAFRVILDSDPQQEVAGAENWDALAVRIQIFKALDTIQASFPRPMTTFMDAYMNSSLKHLSVLLPTFTHFYVVGTDSPPGSSEDDAVGIPDLVCPLLDFVSATIRRGKAKDWLTAETSDVLVGSVINYAQMTEEDEENWANNANAFVAQEDDNTYAYNVRIACFDLLSSLVDRSPARICAAFQSNVQGLLVVSQRGREQGLPNWWKSLEAALAAIGSQSEVITEAIESEIDAGRSSPIDIESLLVNVIPSMLTLTEFPFMQGRGFVFASQYSSLLPPAVAGQYLEAAVQVIESPAAGVPVKISAVKAIHNFCQGVSDAALTSFLPRIAHDLGPFLVATTEDTLTLVLETLQIVVETDGGKWMTPEMAGSLVAAVLDVWSRNNKDPLFLSILTDILESLAKSPSHGVYETVVKEALPKLCSQIGTAGVDDWIAESAIDLVDSLVKGAPEKGLGDGFFAVLAPNLFGCLARIEDRDALQSGVICLTNIVRKDSSQIIQWSDGQGHSGLDSVLSVVARILRSEDESGGLAIGDLIIHLLRRVGQAILPVLPDLLQALVNRMPSAKTASFLQSLVMPFAFLMQTERDTVLALLESTNVDGRSGLDILVQTWCENAETFQGFWPNRISNLALTLMYLSERPSLQHLMVKGDIIHRPETSNVIMTRSKTKTMPLEFTSIPFPVKAVKILVHELRSGGESAAINAQDNFELDSDDGDEDWTEEEKLNQGFNKEEFEFLSDMLGPRGVAFDNDDVLDDEEDGDLKDDPVSQMDMQAHLIGFLRDCNSRNTGDFTNIVGQLSAEEMLVVQRAVSQ